MDVINYYAPVARTNQTVVVTVLATFRGLSRKVTFRVFSTELLQHRMSLLLYSNEDLVISDVGWTTRPSVVLVFADLSARNDPLNADIPLEQICKHANKNNVFQIVKASGFCRRENGCGLTSMHRKAARFRKKI